MITAILSPHVYMQGVQSAWIPDQTINQTNKQTSNHIFFSISFRPKNTLQITLKGPWMLSWYGVNWNEEKS